MDMDMKMHLLLANFFYPAEFKLPSLCLHLSLPGLGLGLLASFLTLHLGTDKLNDFACVRTVVHFLHCLGRAFQIGGIEAEETLIKIGRRHGACCCC